MCVLACVSLKISWSVTKLEFGIDSSRHLLNKYYVLNTSSKPTSDFRWLCWIVLTHSPSLCFLSHSSCPPQNAGVSLGHCAFQLCHNYRNKIIAFPSNINSKTTSYRNPNIAKDIGETQYSFLEQSTKITHLFTK